MSGIKIDRIAPASLPTFVERLSQLVPGRPILATEQGRLDPVDALAAAPRGARPEPEPIAHDGSQITSKTIRFDGPISRERLARFLEALSDGILRVKGFVVVTDASRQLQLVQALGRAWRKRPPG